MGVGVTDKHHWVLHMCHACKWWCVSCLAGLEEAPVREMADDAV